MAFNLRSSLRPGAPRALSALALSLMCLGAQAAPAPALAGTAWQCQQMDVGFNKDGSLLIQSNVQLGAPARVRTSGRFEQRGNSLSMSNTHQWVVNPTPAQRAQFPDVIDFKFNAINEYELRFEGASRMSMKKTRRVFNGKERPVDKTPVEQCSRVG